MSQVSPASTEIATPGGGSDRSPPPAPEAAPLGQAVGGGMSWMVAATVGTRVVSFLAQIMLGWWLLPKDFALYATATSVAGFIMVCRDMATGHLLVQRGREAYHTCDGAAFWIAFTYNVSVAIVGTLAAFPLATHVYHNEELAWMLIVMVWALPISAVGNNLIARLRLDLRFRTFSGILAVSGMFRQLCMIVLAYLGFGAMSFAIPVLLNALFDAAALWYVTRQSPWKRPFQFDQWRGLIRQAVWLMVNSLANFAMDFGPYLLLIPILFVTLNSESQATDITGFYFFAYQITAQIGVVLAYNATLVLMPALQRMKDDPQRQRDAAMRALRTLMLAASFCSLGLASIMRPLEHLLWRGKFEPSVAAILIFGAFYPWRVTFGLCTSILMAQGAFRRLAVLSAFECVGLMAATTAAGIWAPTVTGVAWYTGIWVCFSRLVSTWYVFHKMGGRWTQTMGAMIPAWLVALAAFGTAMWIDGRLQINGLISSSPAVSRLVAKAAGEAHSAIWIERLADAAQVLVTGGMCAAVFALLASLLLADDLRDILRVAPARIRGPLSKLLRLR